MVEIKTTARTDTTKLITFQVTEKERRLLEVLRQLPFGETYLMVDNQHGYPIRIEIDRLKESILL